MLKSLSIFALQQVNRWAITHLGPYWLCHITLWCGLRLKGPGVLFTNYAILGDDVVIADRKVGIEYESILGDLGVTISSQKSIKSSTGCLEFAKRFLVKCGRVDLSPVSLRSSLLGFCTSFGLCSIYQKYSLKRFTTLLRIGGAGYRTVGSAQHRLSRKWDRIKIISSKPSSSSNFRVLVMQGLSLRTIP